MKNLLFFTILFCSISASSQSLDGIWFNESRKSFIEFRNDSCVLTNEFYYMNEGDSIKNYYPNEFKYESDSLNLVIIDKYYSTGIIFWKQTDKAHYQISQLTETNLTLKSNPKNAKKAGVITDLIGLKNLDYKRITRKEYLEKIKN